MYKICACIYVSTWTTRLQFFYIIQSKEDKYQLFIYFCFCLKRYISVHDIKYSSFVHDIKFSSFVHKIFSSCHIYLVIHIHIKGHKWFFFPMPKQNKTQTVSTLIEVDIHFCYLEHKFNVYFQDMLSQFHIYF